MTLSKSQPWATLYQPTNRIPNFSSYSLHLAREDRLHEELEERIAAAADGEEGREDGHVSELPPWEPWLGPGLFSHARIGRLGSAGASGIGAAMRPAEGIDAGAASSSSPTVGVGAARAGVAACPRAGPRPPGAAGR